MIGDAFHRIMVSWSKECMCEKRERVKNVNLCQAMQSSRGSCVTSMPLGKVSTGTGTATTETYFHQPQDEVRGP
jgi:hypothetical protein